MNNTSIFVITSENPDKIVNKLQNVFNITDQSPLKHSTYSYRSSKKKVECHITSKEKDLIDLYLSKNKYKNIQYFSLWKYMNMNSDKISHTTLGGYLRHCGYSPVTVSLNGKNKRVWNKI